MGLDDSSNLLSRIEERGTSQFETLKLCQKNAKHHSITIFLGLVREDI